MKFTPGPWTASTWSDPYADVHGFSICAGGNLLPLNSETGDIDEAEANARLISAAPEMYGTLKRIAEGCSFPADDVQRAIRDTARAVLAKVDQ